MFDPFRVVLRFDYRSVGLPTAIEFHAFSVKTNHVDLRSVGDAHGYLISRLQREASTSPQGTNLIAGGNAPPETRCMNPIDPVRVGLNSRLQRENKSC